MENELRNTFAVFSYIPWLLMYLSTSIPFHLFPAAQPTFCSIYFLLGVLKHAQPHRPCSKHGHWAQQRHKQARDWNSSHNSMVKLAWPLIVVEISKDSLLGKLGSIKSLVLSHATVTTGAVPRVQQYGCKILSKEKVKHPYLKKLTF